MGYQIENYVDPNAAANDLNALPTHLLLTTRLIDMEALKIATKEVNDAPDAYIEEGQNLKTALLEKANKMIKMATLPIFGAIGGIAICEVLSNLLNLPEGLQGIKTAVDLTLTYLGVRLAYKPLTTGMALRVLGNSINTKNELPPQ
jgi:Na+/H+ antiporter NhaA